MTLTAKSGESNNKQKSYPIFKIRYLLIFRIIQMLPFCYCDNRKQRGQAVCVGRIIIPTLQRLFDSKQICLEFVSTFAFCYTDCLYYPECFDSCYHCVITFDNRVSIPHILNNFNRILSFFLIIQNIFLF